MDVRQDIIKEEYQPKVDELLRECTECGDCFYNCNFQLWGNNRKDAVHMVKEANGFLRGEKPLDNFKHKLPPLFHCRRMH